ncbi:MAG: DEAD/DEAH box helicase [Armatimonadetes bacterium]|nr:DEAD/DEAH box helicase [Armatimonadota bacterium]
MSSPRSSSEPTPPPSVAFTRLHEKVQRWIWLQQWRELRDVQEQAVEPILAGQDVILAAATAGGKTEAAFLPICSGLVDSLPAGVAVLDVSPLKALINDQYDRLAAFCETLHIPVHRWHGDVSSNRKHQLIREPSGILLITPESLEALFVHHGAKLRRVFWGLQYVVIDELHAFIGAERGRQLQSLLHRLELLLRRRVPRIGLSATLGDMRLAAGYLRPNGGDRVCLVVSDETGQEVRLILRGYRRSPVEETQVGQAPQDAEGSTDSSHTSDVGAIADHLFQKLRGRDHLVFANSRNNVERYADLLRRLSDERRVPNEFFPHHGSLSKELREDVEARLKDKTKPATVICTSTLELGIDVGDVESIAQIGAPPSVAGMRQRLGRSGRREGKPAVLRIFVPEPGLADRSPPQDHLRAQLVQSVAMVNLLVARWCEPPADGALHLSTLVQQVLSLVVQHGGVRPTEAWRALCEGGPFGAVGQTLFADLLRALSAEDLIQERDGALLLGSRGERVANHFSFYTAFITPEEYRIITGMRTLGAIPIDYPLVEGMYIIFAGHRWEVISVNVEEKTVEVAPAAGGQPPAFGGTGAAVHDRVRQEMLAVYRSAEVPVFLDSVARELLNEGRASFSRYGLGLRSRLQHGDDCLLFPWVGDRVMNTLLVLLLSRGLKVAQDGVALTVERTTANELRGHLRALASETPPSAETLASVVRNKRTQKYHWCLTEALLCRDYASTHLDPSGAWTALQALVE